MDEKDKTICRDQDAFMGIIVSCVKDCEMSTELMGIPNPRVRAIWDIAQKRLEESHKMHPFKPEEIRDTRNARDARHERRDGGIGK